MIRALKNRIKEYLNKDFISNVTMYDYPFDLKKGDMLYVRSFGNKNPDKKFYIIWRDYYGAGFFSNYAFVIAHILIAKKNNFIPIIDFENFKTIYNEKESINGSENAWNYYFERLSDYSLEEVYGSKNVLFCNGGFPNGFSYNLTEIEGANQLSKEIKINKTVENFIQSSLKTDSTYVGVHFRGKEQNLASHHPFGPTYKQLVSNTKMLLEKYNLSKIFIVTEDLKAIETLEKKFPKAVFYTNSYRTKKGNAYKELEARKHHRYLLGLEILRDAHLLSQCGGILHSDSNVNEYARLINDHQYKFQCEIKNGFNTHHPIYSKFKYKLIKYLPQQFGGLLNEVIIKEKA
ncbi:MAG: hypothetical protein WC622_09545 [Pedobacter sp.]|jgi:hypothetical protein|uniref:hypothetical protein n=1 Tax=Pedobacter sp. TaxID=1411316 RepID=UPI00356233EB